MTRLLRVLACRRQGQGVADGSEAGACWVSLPVAGSGVAELVLLGWGVLVAVESLSCWAPLSEPEPEPEVPSPDVVPAELVGEAEGVGEGVPWSWEVPAWTELSGCPFVLGPTMARICCSYDVSWSRISSRGTEEMWDP
jgi:hypothetical protein